MADRIILHCDLNNFFASVSLLFNPTLKDMPVAVCGDKENRHGIVLAKNEIAKRYGVKTAEAIFEAKRKCHDLVLLPPIYSKYEEYSKKAQEIYRRFTDMIEPFGIDECWLDVTGSTVLFGDGEDIAHKIKETIKKELGITASVGVSFNKVFAKLGSDMKKPDGVTVISRENFKEKIWGMPISDLLFVGNKTCEKLRSIGVKTIGDITYCDDESLKKLLGKNGLELKHYALGEDRSPVLTPTKEDKPKSVGKSVTSGKDFTTNEEVWRAFLSFAETLCETLKEKGVYAGGVQVHIRTASLKVTEFSRNFSDTTNCALPLAKRGFKLFCENYTFGEPLRSVGLRAINLKTEKLGGQLDLFGNTENDEKTEQVDRSVYSVRQKFGKESVKRGRNI
ncbi:MAG: DNA polymerase IV [Clostridia bacterium]|nr:DNA polymerase IV [Clostridia bacterium]